MANDSPVKRKKHKNEEKTVVCPVEGCEKETLARGLHLHVLKSTSDGHGKADEIPENVDLDSAEAVGTREVQMEYPESRDSEQVARLCPYCKRPYRGKHGVMIHLGQLAGKKNHPEDATEKHDLDDFPVVHVDEDGNVVEMVDDDATMPSTERRLEDKTDDLDQSAVEQHIQELREKGLDEEADRAEKMLLGK